MVAPSDPESTPSTLDVDAISSRRFSTSFRGWNPDEVRVHLVEVAEMVRSLQHRQGELERLLAEAEAAARKADLTRLDPDEVARVMGEETARVLRTARAAAEEIEAKTQAQADLLAGQAADDAARVRADAAAEAAQIRAEAQEAAAATRTAGEAHLADVRAAGEAELEARREQMETELAAEREQVREELAALTAEAQEAAAESRRVAESDASAVRAEADEYAAAQRAAVEAELTQRRAVTEQEVGILVEQANVQVAEAERMRERILADLAKKRRAARKHLEQLHAGRDRLLTAYEVIRATTDQATGELSVVLGDAKRAADDAARRVGSEALPTPEEMLAELDLARMADLPIISDDDASGADDTSGEDDLDGSDAVDPDPAAAGPVGGDAESDGSAGASETDTDAGTDAVVSDDAGEGDAVPDVDGAEQPDPGSPTDAPDDAPADGGSGPTADVGSGSASRVGAQPIDPLQLVHRRHGRRARRRHDPLEGESLPDVPMTQVDASAEFEHVRVVAVDEPEEDTTAAVAVESAAPAVAPKRGEVSPSTTKTEPAVETAAAPGPSASETVANEPASSNPAGADPASDIFARLRADREKSEEQSAGSTPDVASSSDRESGALAGRPSTAKVPAVKTPATEPSEKHEPTPASTPKKSEAPAAKAAPVKGPAPQTMSQSAPSKSSSSAATPSRSGSTPAVSADSSAKAKPAAAKSTSPKKKAGPGAARYDDDRLASLFERRDASVDEVARRLAKHLKRRLSDQQSDLLDRLRRNKGAVDIEAMLGPADEFAADWSEGIRDDLAGAVAGGAALVGDVRGDAIDHADVDLHEVAAALVDTIAAPLRARLARALGEGTSEADEETVDVDGLELADRIRACYREWRGARLTASVADACARAFGLGVRAATPVSVGLRWFCGPADGPCSDCNDNQLAGTVAVGEAFPTGQTVAPAHPGCRCLALPDPA